MDLIELSRRLENVIRIGTILEIDHACERVRVKSGKLESEWLRWIERRAGTTATWCPPTFGEQCIIFSPSGELAGGIVFPGIPGGEYSTPSHDKAKQVVKFPDGATFTYDHAASHLEITGIKTASISASEQITFDTPLTHITGKCIVDDLLAYLNGLAGTGGSYGSKIEGNIEHKGNLTQSDGALSSNGIVLDDHGHTNVQPGNGISGAPTK